MSTANGLGEGADHACIKLNTCKHARLSNGGPVDDTLYGFHYTLIWDLPGDLPIWDTPGCAQVLSCLESFSFLGMLKLKSATAANQPLGECLRFGCAFVQTQRHMLALVSHDHVFFLK